MQTCYYLIFLEVCGIINSINKEIRGAKASLGFLPYREDS